VLIPSNPEMLSIMGIPALLESVEQVQTMVNPGLSILGVLPTRFDARRSQDKARMQDLANMAAENRLRLFAPVRNAVIYVEGGQRRRSGAQARSQRAGAGRVRGGDGGPAGAGRPGPGGDAWRVTGRRATRR